MRLAVIVFWSLLSLPSFAYHPYDQASSLADIANQIRRIAPQDIAQICQTSHPGNEACQLELAIINHYPKLVKRLLEEGMDANAISEDGISPLIRSIQLGQTEITEILLTGGADANLADNSGWTPLHYAILGLTTDTQSQLKLIKTLAQHNANLNARSNINNTPLHFAAEENLPEVARILIELGAELDIQDIDQWTPLMLAINQGSVKVAQLLIQSGASLTIRNRDGWQALHFTANKKSQSSGKSRLKIAKALLKAGAPLESVTKDGSSPLWLAAANSQPDLLKFFIEQGGDVNHTNHKGLNLMHQLVTYEHLLPESQLNQIFDILYTAGINLNKGQSIGLTPLMIACIRQERFWVKKLLAHNANPDQTAQNNISPLYIVLKYQKTLNVPILIELLEHGVAINQSIDGWSLINMTLSNFKLTEAEQNQAVKLLIQYGADINGKRSGEHEYAPIQLAVQLNQKSIVKTLIVAGAQLDITTEKGASLLELAVNTRSKALTTLILAAKN